MCKCHVEGCVLTSRNTQHKEIHPNSSEDSCQENNAISLSLGTIIDIWPFCEKVA